MVDRVSCPFCGNWFKSLGSHYAENPSHRPPLEPEELEMITGMLMGDGYIVENKDAPSIGIGMVRKPYLEQIKLKHPRLFNDIYHEERSGNHADFYKMVSIPHPDIEPLRDWYNSGKKEFPHDLQLTPRIVRHWYCGDGSLSWTGNSKSAASAHIHSENENLEFLRSLFDKTLFDPTPHGGKSLYFSREKTPHFLGWIGPAPPGFRYKWTWNDYEQYQSRKKHNSSQLSQQLIDQCERDIDKRRAKIKALQETVGDLQAQLEATPGQSSIEKAERKAAKRRRNEIISDLYTHPEIQVSQSVLAEVAEVTQQQISNIVNNEGGGDG